MESVFGRTNRSLPPTWLKLEAGGLDRDEALELARYAASKGAPLDVTSSPSLWGMALRDQNSVLSVRGGLDIESAGSETHAFDLLSAHLIETLSCLTVRTLDFYFLKLRRGLEEHQISGAIQALTAAKQDGLLRHTGFEACSPAFAVLANWQFNDAFEAAIIPAGTENEPLFNLAKERRLGVLTLGENLVAVQSRADVDRALG